MKILRFDKKSGEMKILPENENDWIVFEKIIRKGDIVKGYSTRSILIDKGGRKEKVRKKVFVVLEVEKIELTDSGVRINGIILNESEFLQKGSHHTLEVKDHEFILQREWTKSEIEYLKRFESKTEPVIVVLIDDSEAQVYEVGEKEKLIAEFRWQSGKTLGEQKKDLSELVSLIKSRYDGRLIIAGPGFAKESLSKQIKDLPHVLDSTSHTGIAGLREVINRGLIERVEKNIRIGKESRIVDEFFRRIATDGLVTYGRTNVESYLQIGAVETLIISDRFISDPIVQEAEKYGSNVEIISSSHDQGKRFLAFGGYGAFLRFK